MRTELIVAEKEFRDHIVSKRFIVIFGILMMLAVYTITTGMDAYNQQLDQYKNPQRDPSYQARQDLVRMYQWEIDNATAANASAAYIQTLQGQLEAARNVPMPSVLDVFQSMVLLFTFVGMILGASLGFDQIAKEREDGTMKFLVSSPVYRDAIINGKTIGALATLACAIAAAFAFAIAIVMLKGVVPGAEDLARLFLFFIGALLYCTVFFAIGMMMSAIARTTTIAAVAVVGFIFALVIFSILAAFLASFVADSIVGPMPETSYAHDDYQVNYQATNLSDENGTSTPVPYYYSYLDDPGYVYYQRKSAVTAEIADALSTISPIDDFFGLFSSAGHPGIATAMLMKQSGDYYGGTTYINGVRVSDKEGHPMSLLDSLAAVWIKVLALVVEIVAAFGVAYVAFMRSDIR